MFKSTSSAGHLVNWAARLFVRDIDRRIRPLQISSGQILVFLALAESRHLTQTQLVQQAVTEQPTIAATLQRMQKVGYVSRQVDPTDGRAALFTLTVKGRSLLSSLYKALEQGNANALAGFKPKETLVFLDMLTRVIGNISRSEKAAARKSERVSN